MGMHIEMKPTQRPNFYRSKHDGRRVSAWDWPDGDVTWMLDPLPVIAPACCDTLTGTAFTQAYVEIPAPPPPTAATSTVAMATANGWIFHDGGACPVAPADKVHFRTLTELSDRNPSISEDIEGRSADTLRWEWKEFQPIDEMRNDNIVVYRVVTRAVT